MSSPQQMSHKNMGGLRVENLGSSNSGDDAVNRTELDTDIASAKARSNHTGTQVASTISNFDTQVRTSRLDQMAAPTGSVAFGSQKITGLADPTSAQEGATKNYVDLQVAGLLSGQTLKGTVRVLVGTNVNISSPGANLDGIAMSAGDIAILNAQSTGSEKGPWVWNGAAVPMTRPANWDTSAEAVLGSYWIVREGTSADRFALMTNDTAVTLGTTTLNFTTTPIAPSANTYSETSPATAAGGTWTATHNLGTRRVIPMLVRTSSPFDFLGPGQVRINAATVNTVTVEPDIAISAGEYDLMISKIG